MTFSWTTWGWPIWLGCGYAFAPFHQLIIPFLLVIFANIRFNVKNFLELSFLVGADAANRTLRIPGYHVSVASAPEENFLRCLGLIPIVAEGLHSLSPSLEYRDDT